MITIRSFACMLSKDKKLPFFRWQGFHDAKFLNLFHECWVANRLLICCPPKLENESFFEDFVASIENQNTTKLNQAVLGVFTTGTTRHQQKLVLYSKENILSCQNAIWNLYDKNKIQNIFCYPQPYHVFGLLLGYALSIEKKIPLLAPTGPYRSEHHHFWCKNVDHNTLTLATPVHLRDLNHFCKETNYTPRESYSCLLGGAPVHKKDWWNARNNLNIAFPSIGYGCTEASPGISHLPPGTEPLDDGDIGYPLGIGLINLQNEGFKYYGPNVALATFEGNYLNFPNEIEVKDRLTQLADGRLVFSGRSDLTLNRGGEKFSLEGIELFLKNRFGFEFICLAIEDQRLGQELGILTTKNRLSDSSLIFRSLEEKFGRKFNPQNLILLDKFPINDQSKIDRKKAKQIYERQASP